MGVFLFFGAAMASYAGFTLTWRGTALDRAWQLNATAYAEMSRHGTWIGIPFFVLSAALLAAGIGWFRRRRWGWGLTVAIMTIQVAGDLVNAARGDWLRGAVGGVAATAILVWLVKGPVRCVFFYTPTRK